MVRRLAASEAFQVTRPGFLGGRNLGVPEQSDTDRAATPRPSPLPGPSPSSQRSSSLNVYIEMANGHKTAHHLAAPTATRQTGRVEAGMFPLVI